MQKKAKKKNPADTTMRNINIKDIRSLNPCYDPAKHLPEDWQGTVVDILKHQTIPPRDKLWVVCREELIDARTLRLFAVWCARQVEHLMTDERSKNALVVAERFANGHATSEELDAACTAAWAAAVAAAWDAAWNAAVAAAWDAAWNAARNAAWDAAWNAAWAAAWNATGAAARNAAWDAARNAAWDAAWNAQIARLIEMVEEQAEQQRTEGGREELPNKAVGPVEPFENQPAFGVSPRRRA